MTGVIATIPRMQFSSALGVPLVAGKLYTYLAGTTTPATTYQDQALTTANENPIQLDATGSCTMWLDPAKSYKFALKNSLDVTQPGWPVDNISGASTVPSLGPTLSEYARLSSLASPAGANAIGFQPSGAGASPTTLQAALDTFNQKSTGRLWAEDGARVNRIADRLFVGDAIVCDGRAVPVVGTWLKDVNAGVYEYLESNATLISPATAQGIGVFGGARTSTQSGGVDAAAIGIAGFSVNDYVGGAGGSWGFYSTVLRKSGATGPTHGMEIDVANMGATVIADPYVVNPAGLTNAMRLCAGGETTGTGICTYALAIISNDPTYSAKFDKGIVFQAEAIAGTNGITGTGTAIALAKGHTLTWHNSSHQETSYIYSAVTTRANGQGIIFTDNGTTIVGVADQTIQFQIAPTSGAANHLLAIASATGSAPTLTVDGTDANQDFKIGGKGNGVMHFVQSTVTPAGGAGSLTLSNYLSIKVNGASFKLPLYS